jgi:hypothetical protein
MTRKKAPTHRLTPAEQHARFVEAAKKAGADERPEAFDKVFKRIVPSKKKAAERQ